MLRRLSPGLRSLGRNAAWGVASRLVELLLRLVYVLALARLLGGAAYGLYVYALSWYVLFMPLTNLGQELELARAMGARPGDAAREAGATFTLRLYAALVVSGIAGSTGWLLNPDEAGRALVVAMTAAMVPRALALWSQTVFVLFERSAWVLRQELRFRLAEVAAGIAALWLGADLLVLALVHGLAWSAQAATGVWLVRRHCVRFAWSPRVPDGRRRIADGLKVGGGRVMEGWLVAGPVILFRHLSADLPTLGLLAFATQLLNLLRVVPHALSSAALPWLGRGLARADGTAAHFLALLAGLALAQGAGAALAIGLLGEPVVTHLLGADFAGITPTLLAVCWIAVLPALGSGIGKVIGIEARYDRLLLASAAGLAVMLALAWPAFMWLGAVGLLLASGLGSLVWVLAQAAGRARADLLGATAGGALGAALPGLIAAGGWAGADLGSGGAAGWAWSLGALAAGMLLGAAGGRWSGRSATATGPRAAAPERT